jgi:DnaK suppressor protein
MTKEEKLNLKNSIEKKIIEVKELIEELKEATQPLGLDNAVGRLSRMDYINNKSVNEAGLRAAEKKLAGLERWMSVYDTDKFGRCNKCNKYININRLLLMPESSLCINCAR